MEPPPAKRARVSAEAELPLPMETTNQQADHDSPWTDPAAMVAGASDRPWQLPRSQSLAVNEKYLNDQLEHVVAMGLTTTQQQQPRYQRLQRANQDESGDAEDEDAFGQLQLNDVWRYVRLMPVPEEPSAAANKELQDGSRVEKRLRDAMDLVSFLLFLRHDDLERQNGLHETIQRMEKEMQRKTNAVQALTAETEMHKQSLAQQENYFTAKEESFKNERKMLQADKKALEVLCAKYVQHCRRGQWPLPTLCVMVPGCRVWKRRTRQSCAGRTWTTSGCARRCRTQSLEYRRKSGSVGICTQTEPRIVIDDHRVFRRVPVSCWALN